MINDGKRVALKKPCENEKLDCADKLSLEFQEINCITGLKIDLIGE